MVGVAGRSKGCKTCRQRKVACSLEKPQCQVCFKAKRECGGYARDRVFIMDPRTVKTISTGRDAKLKNASSSCIDERLALDASKASNITHKSTRHVTSSAKLEATIPTRSAFSHLSSIKSPTIRTLYREQILAEFLHSYLPATSKIATGSWLAVLPTHLHFTTALEATTLAISTARLGRLHSDDALVRESLKFYTQGLYELQRALWDERTMYQDETLAACLSLIMYEVFECPGQNISAWMRHMKGCARLFQLRGPKSYNTDFGSKLFSGFRGIEIPQAITERRTTFLLEKDWMELPWKGRVKPAIHRILDLMAEVAEIVARAYRAFEKLSAPERFKELIPALLDILKRAWIQDTKLEAFFRRFEKETNGPPYWTRMSNGYNKKVLPEDDLDVFPVAFHFPNILTAYVCLLYWATCSILWAGMSFVYRFLSALPSPQAESSSTSRLEDTASTHPLLARCPPLLHRVDTSSLAKNVCQSLEYYLQPGLGEGTATTAVLPLKVAIESLHDSPGCEQELKWAKRVFERICGQGVKILENLGVDVESHSYLPG